VNILAALAFSFLIASAALSQDRAAPAGKDINVTANSMEADGPGRIVTFRGDVVAEGEFRLCAGELVVYYDETEEIKEIKASGDVRIAGADKNARGDEGVYDRKKGIVVLTGNAVAAQCSDVVKGEKIIFNLPRNTMAVEGGDKRVKAVVAPKKDCKEQGGEEFKCAKTR
jgi:lipopolysaccharide transport protein LptA